jgi:hypothetical protein
VGRPPVRHPERSLHAGVDERPQRLLELLAGARLLVQVGALEELVVAVAGERVDVQGDAVADSLVGARLPHLGGVLRPVELQLVEDVVERVDGLPGGLRGELLEVHGPDVRALAGVHGSDHALVVLRPVDGVLVDGDQVLGGVEVGDQLLHRRSVATGEAVPVADRHRRAVVRLAEGGAGVDQRLARSGAAGQGAGADPTGDGEELTSGQGHGFPPRIRWTGEIRPRGRILHLLPTG